MDPNHSIVIHDRHNWTIFSCLSRLMNLYLDKKKKRKERREEEYKTNRTKSQDESDFLSNIEGR